jgi:hypothetical protein
MVEKMKLKTNFIEYDEEDVEFLEEKATFRATSMTDLDDVEEGEEIEIHSINTQLRIVPESDKRKELSPISFDVLIPKTKSNIKRFIRRICFDDDYWSVKEEKYTGHEYEFIRIYYDEEAEIQVKEKWVDSTHVPYEYEVDDSDKEELVTEMI